MGDIANEHVGNFLSGRWGIPIPPKREYPTTTRAAIAGQRFHIVEVAGGGTNRVQGTKLVVCDNTPETYWVWASKGVTGIKKEHCRVIEADLSLADALARTGRKPYTPPPPPAGT